MNTVEFKSILAEGVPGLSKAFKTWSKQSVTGRVESWINNSESRLPVSCTVYVVDETNVKASFIFTSKGLRNSAGVAIHLPNKISQRPVPKVNWRVYIGTDHPDANSSEVEPKELVAPLVNERVIKVADSMEYAAADNCVSIEQSWLDFMQLASTVDTQVTPIVLDLSRLRAEGTENGRGLVSSGPVSFKLVYIALAEYLESATLTSLAKVYSTLNQVLRRGGIFKNGAITLHYDYDNEHVIEFLNVPRHEIPWAKRALNIDKGITSQDFSSKIFPTLIPKMQGGDVWIVKKLYDTTGARIYLQVCLEIAIKHRATCLLLHGNLGQCRIQDVAETMKEGVELLCLLHAYTGVGESGIYLSPEEDRQVGYGFLGLANLLAIEDIKYRELVDALKYVLGKTNVPSYNYSANLLAEQLKKGYELGNEVGRKYNMSRVWTIAPTATCSYKYKDREGWTTTPEIAPPINRIVERDSSTFGIETYNYHPNCETAVEVGWDTFFELNECIQELMDSEDMGHSISMNWWADLVYCDEAFILKFIESNIKSLYYSLQVKPNLQDKSSIYTAIGEVIDFSLFSLETELEDEQVPIEKFHCTSCGE